MDCLYISRVIRPVRKRCLNQLSTHQNSAPHTSTHLSPHHTSSTMRLVAYSSQHSSLLLFALLILISASTTSTAPLITSTNTKPSITLIPRISTLSSSSAASSSARDYIHLKSGFSLWRRIDDSSAHELVFNGLAVRQLWVFAGMVVVAGVMWVM